MQRVLVLHSGDSNNASPEMQDTLKQVEEISTLLTALGHDVRCQFFNDIRAKNRTEIQENFDFVFNLVEDIDGDDALIHKATEWLDKVGIRYSGNPTSAFLRVADKPSSKKQLQRNALPTPPWFELENSGSGTQKIEGSYIVKSSSLHGSVGINDDSVVRSYDEANTRMKQMQKRYGGAWFAEQFIEGRELNVALIEIGGHVSVLPIAEICFDNLDKHKPRIVGYAAKWEEDSHEYQHTPRSFLFAQADRPMLESVSQLAKQCWGVFGLKGYARVDFRIDSDGQPWIIDINPNPCLSQDGGFMAAAKEAGFAPHQIINYIIQAVCEEMV